MLEFINDNLDIILNIIYLTVTFLGLCFSYYFKVKTTLSEQINKAINDAEDLDVIGAEKLEAATNQVMEYVPAVVKPFLPRNVVKQLIQNSFDVIEAYAKKQVK